MEKSRHFSRCMGRWLITLLLVMLTSLAARAAEAYACYTSSNTTLTFYYDGQRGSRTGTTYDLNTGAAYPGWYTDGTRNNVTQVVFDPSFADARPTTTYRWFYYMTRLTSITGMKEYLNTSEVTNMSAMFYYCSGLTSLDVSSFNTSNVIDMGSMFSNCMALTSLDVSGFNTANVTYMDFMFNSCNSLPSLDVSGFNTAKVTDMRGMFRNCYVSSLDLSNFNTANVTDMSYMFYDSRKLTTIYVGNKWSTAAVTNSTDMFLYCSRLVGGQGTAYDAIHVDKTYAHIDGGPSNPGYFSEKEPEAYACYTPENTTLMFYYDNLRSSRSGTTYDLNTGNSSPGWKIDGTNANVTKVVFDPSFADARPTSTYTWFYLMSNLQSITGISYLNTSQVTNMGYMFKGCESLTSLDLTHFNTEGVMSMNDMFYYCIGLTDLDLSSFNTANVTRMEYMFGEAYNLAHIVVGDEWSTTAVTNSAGMFNRCEKLVGSMGTTYDASHVDKAYAHIDGGPSNPGYLSGKPEAYAAYTSSNTTLTFYYDDQRSSRAETYDLNTDDKPLWFYYGINVYVTKVVFDPSFADARPTTTYGWFEGMFLLQSITGVNNLNTSEVTNTAEMFYGCNNLPSLDVSHFNTANVTDMSKMFGECRALTSLDLSHFNTANVTNMSDMFYDCRALTSLDVSNFNTAKATNMSAMFRGCSYLESLDLRSFNTANVTNMSDMFYGCYYLTSLDLSSFNTANVTEMNQMFYHCFMTTIYVGNEWSTVAVTNSRNMFYNCTRLVGGQGTTYDASHVDKAYAHIDGGPSNPGYLSGKTEAYAAYTADNTTLTFYYDGQRSLRTGSTYDLNRGSNNPGWLDDEVSYSVTHVVFDPSFVDARPDVTFCWFSGMNSLVSITGMREYLNTSEVRDMYAMFFSCRLLTDIDVSNFNTAKVTDMRFMFSMCNGLTSLDLSSFNTANVTEMSNMFYNCNHLTTIDVGSGWSTASTNYSADMFMGCTSLVGGMGTTYDPSHVDAEYAHIDGGTSNPGYFTGKAPEAYACYTADNTTLTFYCDLERSDRVGTTYDLNRGSNNPGWLDDEVSYSVTHVVFDPSFVDARPTSTHMWFFCMENVTSIAGINYLNTTEVTDMAAMFMECNSLTSLDLSHFNTAKVTDMFHMFYGCRNLTSVNLSSFNTAKVADMRGMFRYCSMLTSLDLSSFNTAKVHHMGMMFLQDSNLSTVYVGSGWSTASINVSADMFLNCTSLVGGKGTTYDANHVDAEYAHIDGGTSNPGYFTEKPTFQRGDVNRDGFVDVADVTTLIAIILNSQPVDHAIADLNDDGDIDVADVTTLIALILSS